MSFILDALRKSDQQRQRSVTPALLTAQAPVVESRQPALWWYGLFAAVLIGVGILIGWMHQWRPEPAVPAIQSDAGRPLESSTHQSNSAPLPVVPALPALPRKPENPQPPRETTAQTQSDTPALMPAKRLMDHPSVAVASSPSVAPVSVHEEHARIVPGDAVRESGVMAPTELSPALQQEIPKLVILVHSYSSKPKSRFVFINDRRWQEEEYPVPGIKLEQITPDGVIFSYKGYRFRRGINP